MNIQTSTFGALLTFFLSIGGSAQEAGGPHYLQGEHLIVTQVKDANEFLAYSKVSGKWARHTFPDDVVATPVMGDRVCAFQLEGEKITELVVVDRQGEWRTVKLLMSTGSTCVPVVSSALAVFQVDGRVYAFSADVGKWDAIDAAAPAAVGDDLVTIVSPDRIAAFSSATGRWAATSLRRDAK
ncbi:MAG: hypothetical protein RIC55_28715 [Pirellulaceae bacterium]